MVLGTASSFVGVESVASCLLFTGPSPESSLLPSLSLESDLDGICSSRDLEGLWLSTVTAELIEYFEAGYKLQ
jgi:hypothetical protein